MSSTNKTTNYELPIFVSSDSPKWLVDWNGAMTAIDSAIYQAKQLAETAGASAASVAADLASLASTVSAQGTSISTLVDSLTTLTGTVNTITSLIGNGEPTTTDKTIIGAINELNAKAVNASAVGYNNTASGLTADDVQEAIDENAAAIAALDSTLADKIIHAPDYTDTITTLNTANTEYTMLVDGWVVGQITSTIDAHAAQIKVNNIIVCTAYYSSTGSQVSSVACIPVKKGDVVKTHNLGTYSLTIYGVL